MEMKRIAAILALFVAVSGHAIAEERLLRVVGFPGGPNWPLWVADEKGFFSGEGLRVEFTPTPTSTFLVSGLMDGKFDVALAAIDNVVAYQEGQGEAQLGAQPDMFAFLTDDGIQPHGTIDMAGIDTVIKLRSEYGLPHRDLNDAAKYVDESYYREAVGR